MLRYFAVASMILGSADAQAQDWDARYRNWRTAGYLSSVAPLAGVALGASIVHQSKEAPPLIDVLLVITGVSVGVTGFAAGTPLMSLSADRGRHVLVAQGAQVPARWAGASWVGSGAATGGVGLLIMGNAFKDRDITDALGLSSAIGGSALAYSAGIVQWGVNRANKDEVLPLASGAVGRGAPLVVVGGRW